MWGFLIENYKCILKKEKTKTSYTIYVLFLMSLML